MGEYPHQIYKEPISTEDNYEYDIYGAYHNRYTADSEYGGCFYDSSEYINRIKGTEHECGITFGKFNYFPILTSRVIENKRKYYLFDRIKVWSEFD